MTEFINYREISAKLKKRFSLKKPNYLEAGESFKKLAQDLNDFKEYSGFCLYSAAQCYHNNVVLLEEQRTKPGGPVNFFLPNSSTSGGGGSSRTGSLSRPGTAVPTDPLTLSSGNISATELGKNRILTVAQQAESQAWLEAARRLCDANEINGSISAYWHSTQTCSSSELPMIYYEWASMLLQQRMFQEAADIFLEGGMLKEAINCLLKGQHFQDAYHCYQELTDGLNKGCKTVDSRTKSISSTNKNSTKSANSSIQSSANKSPQPPTPSSSSSSSSSNLFANFFRQTSSSSSLLKDEKKNDNAENEYSKTPEDFSNLNDRKCANNAFLSQGYLNVDDYINMFLLKLYLYDPVNYEYPTPIVPLPSFDLTEDDKKDDKNVRRQDDTDETENGDDNHMQKQSHFNEFNDKRDGKNEDTEIANKLERLALEGGCEKDCLLRFVDFNVRSETGFKRNKADLIEINMLFETLFSLLKNELKHTVDHDLKPDTDFDDLYAQCEDNNHTEHKNDDTVLDKQSTSDKDKRKHSTNDEDSVDEQDTPSHQSRTNHSEIGLEMLEELLEQSAKKSTEFYSYKILDDPDNSDKFQTFTQSIHKSLNNLENESTLKFSIQNKLYSLLNPVQNQILHLVLNK